MVTLITKQASSNDQRQQGINEGKDKAENQVNWNRRSNNSNRNRGGNFGNNQYYGNGDQRYSQGSNQNCGPDLQCAYCQIVNDSDSVTAQYENLTFEHAHNLKSGRIFPDKCLIWLSLSFEDRKKALKGSKKIACLQCLRLLEMNTASLGSYCKNNGGLCIVNECHKNATKMPQYAGSLKIRMIRIIPCA